MADRRLQVFHAVARHLSFTKAAEALFMTQPAVTFQIKQLEDQFNTRLFERGHGKITLTAAGQLALEYAERINALSDELDTRLGELTGEMRGPLLVGASTTIAEFLLPPILGNFNCLYPQVNIRLVVGNSEAIETCVGAHGVDLGFTEIPPSNDNLVCELCCEDELQVICAPDHPFAGQKAVVPKTLRDYEFISREQGSGTRSATDAYFQAAGIAPESLKILMELGSPEALKCVVGTGLGFGILSRVACEKERQLGSLVTIPLKPVLKRNLYLVLPKDRFRSRLAGTFIDFAKQKLREQAP